MFKTIFLVGYMCVAGECISINEKYEYADDCIKQGNILKSIVDEQNIRKYFFACVDATDYQNS